MDLYLEDQLQAYWEGVHNVGSWIISRKNSLILEGKEIREKFPCCDLQVNSTDPLLWNNHQ